MNRHDTDVASKPLQGSGARSASTAAEPTWTENRPSEGWRPRIAFRELWKYREVAYFLALRDLKVRYTQTALGVSWALLQPLAGVLIFSVVFGRAAKLPSDSLPYPVFVYAGLTIWTFLSTAVNSAAQSLVESTSLVTKVYFPRLLAPVSAVLPGLIDLAISLVIVAVFMVVYQVSPPIFVVLLPFWVLGGIAVALAVGLWLSALNVLYRDVRYALGFLLQVWFFASPIVFPSSIFDGVWAYLYALNPVVAVVDGLRWSLLGAPGPGVEALVSLAVTLGAMASGLMFFARVERRFADVI